MHIMLRDNIFITQKGSDYLSWKWISKIVLLYSVFTITTAQADKGASRELNDKGEELIQQMEKSNKLGL